VRQTITRFLIQLQKYAFDSACRFRSILRFPRPLLTPLLAPRVLIFCIPLVYKNSLLILFFARPLPHTRTLSLAPPPTEAIYESVEDAVKALNTFAAIEGYVIVKIRLKSYREVINRVDLQCNKSGKKKS
jgi:hypothetical protein